MSRNSETVLTLRMMTIAISFASLLHVLAAATQAVPFDLIVTDFGNDVLLRIDPINGNQTVVSSGDNFVFPRDVAIASNGDYIVADALAGGSGAVIRVNPLTGIQIVISSGDNFASGVNGIAIAPNGDLFVTEGVAGLVLRIDPVTGIQTIVASGFPSGAQLSGIEFDANGKLIVVDESSFQGGPLPDPNGAVHRVDPVSGMITLISQENLFEEPTGVAIASDGTLFIADRNTQTLVVGDGAIISVDPITGNQNFVSLGNLFLDPAGIVIDPMTGDLIVTDWNGGGGSIFRVNPTTGVQSVLASGGNLTDPFGIAVELRNGGDGIPEPSTAVLGLLGIVGLISNRRRAA